MPVSRLTAAAMLAGVFASAATLDLRQASILAGGNARARKAAAMIAGEIERRTRLRLRTQGLGGSGRGCQVAEVWLIRVNP
jgi:hypothetical protein